MDNPTTNSFLDQDPVIPHQSYCLFSFLPRSKDLTEKFNKCRYERISEVLTKHKEELLKLITENPENLVNHILVAINDTLLDTENKEGEDKHKSNGAVKFRGSFQNIEEAKKYSTYLSNLDERFDIYLGQTGYWYPFDPADQSIKDEEHRDSELNNLMKGYLENKAKSEIFFKKRMQEMMDQKIKDSLEKGESDDKGVEKEESTSKQVDSTEDEDVVPSS